MTFTGVKVFSASLREDRERLGERVTAWIDAHRSSVEIVDIVQRQSSDRSYHMISITIFYNEPGAPRIDHIIKGPSKTDSSAAGRRLSFKANDK